MLVLVTGCEQARPKVQRDNAQLQEIDLKYAQLFRMYQGAGSMVVEVYDELGKERDPIAKYVFNKDHKQEGLSIPFQRVATSSTTHLPFYTTLGCVNELVACSYLEHVMDSSLRTRIEHGDLLELNSGGGLDKEQLLLANPDVVLAFPFGNGTESIKQAFAGPVLSVTEYLEPHPLGRLEWIKFFGVLQGKEALADSLFTAISARYDSVRTVASFYKTKPTVFFGSFWNGQWHASGGESYMAQLIKDAGGQYLYANSKGSENINITLEELFLEASKVQRFGKILHAQKSITRKDILGEDERVHELIKANNISLFYGNSATSDLFGKGILEPDVMLSSMTNALHQPPSSSKGYFNRIPNEKPLE